MPVDRPYCACATPPGTSGIAVIRMAGLGSAELMDRVFTIRRTFGEAKKVSQIPGYTVAYGVLSDPEDGHKIDEVVCTRFTAPHSYTGEDSIEISCHGGIAVQQEILRVLIRNGARPAEPGEFTKNAFLAGKIDLSQAEAVMDVISAESALALSSAEIQLTGALKNRIREISSDLYTSFAALEMLVEFPEHEDTPQNVNALRMKMQDSLLAMNPAERRIVHSSLQT
ncbi:MAG: tRNA uridine-5-carboxymethylaminomethyl(34) synthesis GTPase MnmE, partial [Clostridiales bacterium]|nr:tRNA uridine-5-carboxymethylaminomethyl(34) synthesis GTPase MnmE [Clostridiales bacterium]